MKHVFVFILGFVVFGLFLFSMSAAEVQGWHWYYELKQSDQSTLGRVTRTDPGHHEAVFYSFRVGENTYRFDNVKVTHLDRAILTHPLLSN